MKRLLVIAFVVSLLLLTWGGSAWSVVSLPTVNFTGNAQTTAGIGTGELTLVDGTAVITQVNYLDGSSTSVNTVDESIIGQKVTITGATRTGNYTFTDATITVSDGSFNYISASLSDVVFVTDGNLWYLNPGLDANNASTLNLSGVTLGTDTGHPSRFIDELQNKLGTNNILGMKMVLTILSGTIDGDSLSNISPGLIDGVTEAVEGPSGARTIGYWKNHDEERNFFISTAVSLSSVFSTNSDLNYYLQKKGKKTMEQKAKQQLAALMLNCASSLPLSTVLATGELEILQLIDPSYDATATVEDAKYEIENVILTSDSGNMENAKDLADEINNRDHGGS